MGERPICTVNAKAGRRLRTTDGHTAYVEPDAIAASGRSILALGRPVIIWDTLGKALTTNNADHRAVGLLIEPGTGAVVVAPPTTESTFVAPIATRRGLQSWDVIWGENTPDTTIHGGVVLLHSVMRDGVWGPTDTVSKFRDLLWLQGGSSGVLPSAEGLTFAAPVRGAMPPGEVALLRETEGSWRLSLVPTGSAASSAYAALAGAHRELTLAYVAEGNALFARVSRDGGLTWSARVRLSEKGAYTPMLHSLGTNGYMLAWKQAVSVEGQHEFQVMYTTSVDRGVHWSVPKALLVGRGRTLDIAAAPLGKNAVLLLAQAGQQLTRVRRMWRIDQNEETLIYQDTVEAATRPLLSALGDGHFVIVWGRGIRMDDGVAPESMMQTIAVRCYDASKQ